MTKINQQDYGELAKDALEMAATIRATKWIDRPLYGEKLKQAAEVLQSLLVENGLKDATIAQLREELQIAIDDHDSHFGRANFVGHWTNTARTLLGDSQP